MKNEITFSEMEKQCFMGYLNGVGEEFNTFSSGKEEIKEKLYNFFQESFSRVSYKYFLITVEGYCAHYNKQDKIIEIFQPAKNFFDWLLSDEEEFEAADEFRQFVADGLIHSLEDGNL